MKTNKSYKKRLRVTKNGKILARKTGQNHFNAKESGSKRRAKRRPVLLTLKNKVKNQFISKSMTNK